MHELHFTYVYTGNEVSFIFILIILQSMNFFDGKMATRSIAPQILLICLAVLLRLSSHRTPSSVEWKHTAPKPTTLTPVFSPPL